MQTTTGQIFWGTLIWDAGDFKLETPDGDGLLVFFEGKLKEYVREHDLADHRRVSILGEGGPDQRGTIVAVLHPSSIVSHHNIAVHAFEIYKSGEGGSAFDNWLTAERRLLESPPC